MDEEGLLVFFRGRLIRYLAPDERGIMFLLLKVYNILTGNSNKKKDKREILKFNGYKVAESTPGIYLQRISTSGFWELHGEPDQIIAIQNAEDSTDRIPLHELLDRITKNSTIVFSKSHLSNLKIPDGYSPINFLLDLTNANFYESELISYIQYKVLERGVN
jgi:hypothetical protein